MSKYIIEKEKETSDAIPLFFALFIMFLVSSFFVTAIAVTAVSDANNEVIGAVLVACFIVSVAHAIGVAHMFSTTETIKEEETITLTKVKEKKR